MQKTKRNLIYILILILLSAGTWWVFTVSKNAKLQGKIETSDRILFYGETCPHCKEVEKYITDNNIKEKIQFSEKEIYKNRDNAKLLLEKAKGCGIKESEVGVPFLWVAPNTCHMGKEEVINFFKNQNK